MRRVLFARAAESPDVPEDVRPLAAAYCGQKDPLEPHGARSQVPGGGSARARRPDLGLAGNGRETRRYRHGGAHALGQGLHAVRPQGDLTSPNNLQAMKNLAAAVS